MHQIRDGRSRMGNYGRNYGGDGFGGSGLLGSGQDYIGGGCVGGSSYGGYEDDSPLKQRSLLQQLSLRESQLALANSLLHQQSVVDGPGSVMGDLNLGGGMHKRQPEFLHGDYQPDFKRPRNDYYGHQARDRFRGRDSSDGNRGFNSRRGTFRPYRNWDRESGRHRYSNDDDDAGKSGSEDAKEGGEDGRCYCHVCKVYCKDDDGFRLHMNGKRHKERMMDVLSVSDEKSAQIFHRINAEKHLKHLEDEEKVHFGFCKVCDTQLDIHFDQHCRLQMHKKRVMQVTRGCGWCGVSSFKNFTEVLAHRETDEHRKNQDSRATGSDHKPVSEADYRRRQPLKIEMPEELIKYDPENPVGQSCIIPVTGWFCKLCNKFYSNEIPAKENHCKTEDHYNKYRRLIYNKLREKAIADREAAEKEAGGKEKGNGSAEGSVENDMDGENDEVRGEEEGDYEEKYDDEESTACEYTDEGWDQQAMEEGEDNQEVADDQEPAEELDEHCLDDVVEEEDEGAVETSTYATADDTIEAEYEEGGDDSVALSLTPGDSTAELIQGSFLQELEGGEDGPLEQESYVQAKRPTRSSQAKGSSGVGHSSRRGRK